MERQRQAAPVRIELTEQQKERLEKLSGKQVSELEFSVLELEQRIAPALTRN